MKKVKVFNKEKRVPLSSYIVLCNFHEVSVAVSTQQYFNREKSNPKLVLTFFLFWNPNFVFLSLFCFDCNRAKNGADATNYQLTVIKQLKIINVYISEFVFIAPLLGNFQFSIRHGRRFPHSIIKYVQYFQIRFDSLRFFYHFLAR